MRIAIVGVTGMVGTEMLHVLADSPIEIEELIPVASQRSVGKKILFRDKEYKVLTLEAALDAVPDIAIFSAGGDLSLMYAPKFAAKGTKVIDNSSAWRMDPDKKLIVPEINAHLIGPGDMIIANPNCSTIQMVMTLAPLHRRFGIRRLVISTYQSVSGTGKRAVDQMTGERQGEEVEKVYPYTIDRNCLPQCDVFMDNGYTKEEMKLVNETRKILEDNNIRITATAVRVPVDGGHSESVNVEFEKEATREDIIAILNETEGVVVQDDPKNHIYPMPLYSKGKDEVFVGRIRKDESLDNAFNFWIVADNLRKGAATNAVQIATYLWKNTLVH